MQLTKAYSLPVGARSDILKFGSDKKSQSKSQQKYTKTSGLSQKVTIVEESKKEPTPPSPKEANLINFEPTQPRHKDSSSSLRKDTDRSLSDTAAVLWDLHQGEQDMRAQTKENIRTTSERKINELPRTPLKASPLRNM